MQKTNFREQFTNVVDACALAQSIVDTVREPVIVLDKQLRVIAASRSFYSAFEVSPERLRHVRLLSGIDRRGGAIVTMI